MLNSYGHFILLLFLVFNNIFKYQLLRAFGHICMEKARYKFLIIIANESGLLEDQKA